MHHRKHPISRGLFLGFLILTTPAWSQDQAADTASLEPAFLVEALRHSESRIRQNAADELGKLGEEAIDPLLPVITRGTPWQTASAAIVLSDLKENTDPIPAGLQKSLYDILTNPETEAWRWNITATLITRIAPESLQDHVELWTWGVKHPSPLIQHPSLLALQRTGPAGTPAQSAVAGLLHRPRQPLTSFMLRPRIITDGLVGLEQAVPDFDPLIILETLAAIEADSALMVEPLTRLTEHPSEYVRLDAAFLLAQVDASQLPADPRPLAARVLADLAVLPWGEVRDLAARRLGEIGPAASEAVPTLAQLLQDRDEDVRLQAAIALGNLGSAAQSAVPALRRALRLAVLDTQAARETITEALEKIENPEETPPAPAKPPAD